MLTAARIRAAAPQARAYKLADEKGLFLYVAPTGLRSWRMAFRFGGKEKLLTFGRFPEISLAQARDARDDARRQLRAGVDPAAARRGAARSAERDRAFATFETAARAWHAQQLPRWSDRHAADVIESLERHVFPRIGGRPLADISAPDVLEVLRLVEAAGAIETARRVRQRISAVFARAIAEGAAVTDPAAIVGRALAARPEVRRQPALLDIEQLRGALKSIEASLAAPAVKLASRLIALTAVRSAVARGARWDEFEDIEPRYGIKRGETVRIDRPVWRIPARRMKLTRARKANAAFDHVVPLAPAAVELLQVARRLGGGELVFPRAGKNQPIGENAIAQAYRAAGLGGRHSPHGWRAAFATIMNERQPAARAAIDLALAHSPKDKVEAAYNRSQQLELRRQLLEDWADALLEGAPSAVALLPADL